MKNKYKAAVITVSDKGSKGEREDTSGPAICDMLRQHGWEIIYTSIVPDEKEEIISELSLCADDLKIPLIITTGGTGFSQRDITPEATIEASERLVPGIPEAMRIYSMKFTSRACLSRSACGIRKYSLILNLPGSKKAALENLEGVIEPVQHGIDMLLTSGSADCAAAE